MTTPSRGAARDPSTNLLVSAGLAGLLYVGWTWGDFSGLFRLFVDVQLQLSGSYDELVAVIASVAVITGAVGLLAVSIKWAYPNLSESAVEAVVVTVFVSASVVALWQVWHLWSEAAHMPRLSDPVRVVDLGTAGNATFPVGHVRVIGTPDRRRLVMSYSEAGNTMGKSYWDAWVPMTARQQEGLGAPVRMVATWRDHDRTAAMKAVSDDPEGLLLFDSVDTRTIYELRQDGLDITDHPFALYADEGVRFNRFIDAALLGSFVVLFWAMAAYSKIKERRSGIPPTSQVAASPPEVEQSPIVETVDVSPGVAMLYVLRDEPGFSSPSYKRVDVDGARVADLQSNQYTAIALPPGAHTLAVNTRVSLTRDTVSHFDVTAGDIVAYRLQIPFVGPMRLERTLDIPEMRVALKRLTLVEPS